MAADEGGIAPDDAIHDGRDDVGGGLLWLLLIVVLVLAVCTWMLSRTRLGRYIYAIGANPEGARRAGINVARIRTAGFALCAMTAGIAGLVYASRLFLVGRNISQSWRS